MVYESKSDYNEIMVNYSININQDLAIVSGKTERSLLVKR